MGHRRRAGRSRPGAADVGEPGLRRAGLHPRHGGAGAQAAQDARRPRAAGGGHRGRRRHQPRHGQAGGGRGSQRARRRERGVQDEGLPRRHRRPSLVPRHSDSDRFDKTSVLLERREALSAGFDFARDERGARYFDQPCQPERVTRSIIVRR